MTGAPDQQQAGQAAVNPGPDRLLFQIQTFTARYDPAEDRLRLDAVDAKGRKQALWLTRRLADRVIPVLVSHLEGKTPDGIPADLAQGMSQSRARQARQTGDIAGRGCGERNADMALPNNSCPESSAGVEHNFYR